MKEKNLKDEKQVKKISEQEIEYGKLSKEPSKELKEALKEAEDILSGKIKSKGYYDIDEMFEDILGK